MKYAFIDKHKSIWPVSVLCEQLEISPSGYHQHRQRQTVSQGKPSGRISNDALLAHICFATKAVNLRPSGNAGFDPMSLHVHDEFVFVQIIVR